MFQIDAFWGGEGRWGKVQKLDYFISIFNLQFDTRVPFLVKIFSKEELHSSLKQNQKIKFDRKT